MTREQLERWRRQFRAIAERNIRTLEFYQETATRRDISRDYERELAWHYHWLGNLS